MTYKARLSINLDNTGETPQINERSSTPECNMGLSVSGNQIVFTHPCIKENSLVTATLCESLDDEIAPFLCPNNGQASLQILNAARQEKRQASVIVSIELIP